MSSSGTWIRTRIQPSRGASGGGSSSTNAGIWFVVIFIYSFVAFLVLKQKRVNFLRLSWVDFCVFSLKEVESYTLLDSLWCCSVFSHHNRPLITQFMITWCCSHLRLIYFFHLFFSILRFSLHAHHKHTLMRVSVDFSTFLAQIKDSPRNVLRYFSL